MDKIRVTIGRRLFTHPRVDGLKTNFVSFDVYENYVMDVRGRLSTAERRAVPDAGRIWREILRGSRVKLPDGTTTLASRPVRMYMRVNDVLVSTEVRVVPTDSLPQQVLVA